MPTDPDAFRHHPGLRDRIQDPETSFFRDLDLSYIDREMTANGAPPDWRYPDQVREDMRADAMAGRWDADLWVFAYGSLMWDPAVDFTEVRRATAEGWSRSLCLVDRIGGRGTQAAPGLMAALDQDGVCEGLVFRLAQETLDPESERVWRREMIGPAYRAVFIPVVTAQGLVTALAFAADHETEMIEADLSRADQVRYLASGQGVMGTSLDYLERLVGQIRALGLSDPELESLLEDARSMAATA